MDKKLPTYEDLVFAIANFNELYPRQGVTISLGEKFDLAKDYNDLSDWFFGKVGVYILLNGEKEVVRVGSATENLYSRLNNYFDYLDDKKVVGTGFWKEGVSTKYICVCEIPHEQVFEALALEKYLLRILTPPLNKEGKSKYVWYRKKMLAELDRLSEVYGWEKVSEKWHN
ncbi:GIY-YIG nuclease family protein [Halomonas daqingensis]|uniref:GIY-YIG nuclease family protein n=1 Tax=Billgrantia desiderata TaxID=52021 RepID=A0AAW4YS74_9GAMM|nr:GIY-YIG nuclease family protein [Halomonas desiderata]MCE8051268.1 GIY-YIG nuclease family protein [Halomonas desiderata]